MITSAELKQLHPLNSNLADKRLDGEQRVVVMTGGGRGFCWGVDHERNCSGPPNVRNREDLESAWPAGQPRLEAGDLRGQEVTWGSQNCAL